MRAALGSVALAACVACAGSRRADEHRELMAALGAQQQDLTLVRATLSAIETEQQNLRARQDELLRAMAEDSPSARTREEEVAWRQEVAAQLDEIEAKLESGATPPPPLARLPGRPDPAATYKMTVAGAASRGSDQAKVTIVECADFRCPFCARVQSTLAELTHSYGAKDLRFVFKHNPLPMHQHAMAAAQAAEAARKQGKFWQMHDRLFESHREIDEEHLRQWARQLGLDMRRFERDFADAKVRGLIEAQSKQCMSLGARGTPAFFVNGRFLSGAQPLEAFRKLIDEEMAKADALLAKGVKRKKLYEATIADGRTEP